MAFIQKIEGKKGSIYKVHFTNPTTGKRQCRSFGRYKDALAFMESPKSSHTSNEASISFAQAADHWLKICIETGRKGHEPIAKATRRKYTHLSSTLKTLVIQTQGEETVLGDVLLARMNKDHCQAVRGRLLELYTRNYAKKFLTCFKSILDQARWDELMSHDPAEQVFLKRSRTEPGLRIDRNEQIPDLADIQEILRTARARTRTSDRTLRRRRRRYKLIVDTIALSGLRPGEVLGLPWKDIDFERNGFWVSQDIEEDGTIGALKSRAAYRFVAMPRAHMRQLRYWRYLCPTSDLDLVFPNWSGKAEFLSNFNKRGWQPILREAELVDETGRHLYPPKSLRHARASLEIDEGANAKELQMLMGHSSIKVTYDVYGHLFDEHASRRQDRCNAIAATLLSRNPPEQVTIL